jgi:hypothetical protein
MSFTRTYLIRYLQKYTLVIQSNNLSNHTILIENNQINFKL